MSGALNRPQETLETVQTTSRSWDRPMRFRGRSDGNDLDQTSCASAVLICKASTLALRPVGLSSTKPPCFKLLALSEAADYMQPCCVNPTSDPLNQRIAVRQADAQWHADGSSPHRSRIDLLHGLKLITARELTPGTEQVVAPNSIPESHASVSAKYDRASTQWPRREDGGYCTGTEQSQEQRANTYDS